MRTSVGFARHHVSGTLESEKRTHSLLSGLDFPPLLLNLPHFVTTSYTHREHEEQTGGRRMRIIVLTAMSLTDDLDRVLALGADGYCTKPFDTHTLVGKIKPALA